MSIFHAWLSTICLCLLLASSFAYRASNGECLLVQNEPCDSSLIKFVLSVRETETVRYEIDPIYPTLPINFNKSLPFKILIHGYGSLLLNNGIISVLNAYENAGYNVVIVNWEALSKVPCYLMASLNTWYVSQCIAMLVIGLIPVGISPSNLHIVGFSLGAHIASFVSNNMKNHTGLSIGRITGLDPALPLFATTSKNAKLDHTDADFVDVIHTSAGSLGKMESSGHVDFYVNGGVSQPTCANYSYPIVCSHEMSGRYFAESVNTDVGFVGVRCVKFSVITPHLCGKYKIALMGEHVNKKKRGSYFVRTSKKPPYALGFNRSALL